MRTHPLPPPDSDCVMQDVQPTAVSSFGCFCFEFWVLRFRTWVLRFRVLGASFSNFGCFVFELGCFVFELWVLRFRVLGASFSNFGCFVFEFWVLRASVFVFECFVFETTFKGSLADISLKITRPYFANSKRFIGMFVYLSFILAELLLKSWQN